ncbi:MAG TPA: carboxymuconolactone decarboxylase family protein [Acidimicrobiales bacterium]|nr:carboxymuconolactone decarboxylase family protein [Acidimicrobiales bacterium]
MDGTGPRIAPADDAPEGLPPLNIFATLAKYPELLDRFNRFGGFLLFKGLVQAREREIVILRVGWRSGSVYEFGQHTVIGMGAGITDEEVRRLVVESTDGWADGDRDLVELADQLCLTNSVDDDLWARLSARWNEQELIELLIVAGFYRLVSGFLNATGVQLEAGTPGWPQA